MEIDKGRCTIQCSYVHFFYEIFFASKVLATNDQCGSAPPTQCNAKQMQVLSMGGRVSKLGVMR